MVDPLTFSPVYDEQDRYLVIGYSAENESIAVDSNTFEDVLLINNKKTKDLLLHIYNSHASNSLDYEIYGHAKESSSAPATDAAGIKQWKELKASTSLAAESETAETLTDHWAWILVRMKRTTTDQDAAAKVWVRAKR